MTRAVALALVMLASGAAAQPAGDPVRLDDLALPQAADSTRAPDQIAPAAPGAMPAQAIDRSLARPQPAERAAPRPAQLSAAGETGPLPQLGSRRDSAPAAGVAISSPRDSAPGGVARIGGRDRCDPQLVQRLYAECLRILELRSAEFAAPEAAPISAEQRLLAEQRMRDETLARSSPTARLRFATATEPDADLTSNQELAAIFLDPAPAPEREEPAEGEQAERLGEVLKGFGIETVPPPPPRGN